MRVAMIDPSLFTGRYDDSLCGALAGLGHDVTLMARPMRETDAILAQNYRYDPHFFRWSERGRTVLGEGKVFRGAKAAEYIAQARIGGLGDMARADVVHVQWLPFPLADTALIERVTRRRDRPVLVHTVHNASAYHGDSGVQGRGYRALLDRFDALIVHGEETCEAMMAQGIRRDKLHIIPHPPMRLAQAKAVDLAAVPDPKAPRILFFGTIRPYKGFDLLIRSALALWRAGEVFELAVAGKPFMDIAPLLEEVRAAGFGDRLITDLGFLREEQLDAHLQKADILAFPYRHIDSSGAFLSALHYGKAMVASRVGMFAALPESDIALCAPDDAEALTAVLSGVLKDAGVRASLGERASALGNGLAQWGDAASETARVYDLVLASSS